MRTLLTFLFFLMISAPATAEIIDMPVVKVTAHGIAIYGAPKYEPDFSHFDYVNPDAPKGGHLKLYALGTFDSLNNYIVKGIPASGLSLTYESLMEQSYDEPFSMYGLLAESITVPKDRSYALFTLRPEAKWQDGQPVTPEDVKWTFETLMEKGKPFFKAYYANVERVEIPTPNQVKFVFNTTNNLELPLIIGQMPVFPKHYWTTEGRDFAQTTLVPPVGSGPYKIANMKPGSSITYERDPNWWGKDLPINKGRYNFDNITYQYYRDQNIALEAFFAEDYNVRQENTAKLWATAYETDAVKTGKIKKEKIKNELPQGMQGFIYNIRRPVFQDIRVREALAYAFDFEWSNKQFAYDSYTRSHSYFSNSEMAAEGLPEGDELALLNQYKDQLPPEVFTEIYTPPASDGSGQNRSNLAKAQSILEEAGYKLGPDGVRVNDHGVRLEFEFIDNNPAFERWILPFIQNLKKIGVKANFRVVDPAQYQKRMTDFDFDMTVLSIPQSSSPGNEQREFWNSAKADIPGSRNYIGIKDPVVDALVEDIIMAQSREELVTACKALDRVLLQGYYVIPNWHMPAWRVAHWDYIKRPETPPDLDLAIADTWWSEGQN